MGRAAIHVTTQCVPCVPPVTVDRAAEGHEADAGARSSLHLGDSSLERRTAGSMSGWGDTLIGSKFEAVQAFLSSTMVFDDAVSRCWAWLWRWLKCRSPSDWLGFDGAIAKVIWL